jgi:hypothetical protein
VPVISVSCDGALAVGVVRAEAPEPCKEVESALPVARRPDRDRAVPVSVPGIQAFFAW